MLPPNKYVIPQIMLSYFTSSETFLLAMKSNITFKTL